MRTTLDIDDDILHLARQLATDSRKSIGAVVSDLARKAIEHRCPSEQLNPLGGEIRNGIFLLPKREGVVVTPEMVKQLLEETDY